MPLNRAVYTAGASALRKPSAASAKSWLERYEQGHRRLIAVGKELNRANKLAVVRNLPPRLKRLELSGGDVATSPDASAVLEAVIARGGVERTTTTIIDDERAPLRIPPAFWDLIQQSHTRVSCAIDASIVADSGHRDRTRPRGYGQGNLSLAAWMLQHGHTHIRGELALHRGLAEGTRLEAMLDHCAEANVPELLIMRPFAVGYAYRKTPLGYDLTPKELVALVERIQQWSEHNRGMPVKFQCALRGLFGEAACDAGSGSWGITPLGDLIVSPWLYDQQQGILIPELRLGNLARNSWEEIFQAEPAPRVVAALADPVRHCRVQAALAAPEGPSLWSFINGQDPLFA